MTLMTSSTMVVPATAGVVIAVWTTGKPTCATADGHRVGHRPARGRVGAGDDEVLGRQGAAGRSPSAVLVLGADEEVLTAGVGRQGGRVVGEGDVLRRR